ncbi:MAG: hypothetical protein DRP85_07360 [Candidatus Makaraimicrobium thalassicum]|nr:MAG: hypothetical protein DRP85_07360 [Candidatus Omnitrophota bacterium]
MTDYKKYYNRLYKQPYQTKRYAKWKGYNKHTKLASSLVAGTRILDIGCGEGIITRQLNGNLVYAIDISENAIKYAKENNKKTRFTIGSASQLPYVDKTFDCVSAFEVLEHLTAKDMHNCLKEIQRICKDHGRIVISTPNRSSIYYAAIRSMRIQNKEHINEMDFIKTINVLSKYFTITSIHSHTGTTWFRTSYATEIISKLQDIFLKLFPPMKSLFYSQIYIVSINTKKNTITPNTKTHTQTNRQTQASTTKNKTTQPLKS